MFYKIREYLIVVCTLTVYTSIFVRAYCDVTSCMDWRTCCQKRECHANSDPHMLTFDGLYWEFQHAGTYIMYRHTTLPVEVQAMFSGCPYPYLAATCPCGVAIRAANSLFIITYCDGAGTRVYSHGQNDGLMVIERPDTSHYKVTLVTGTVIFITQQYYGNSVFGYLAIFSSLADYNHVEGLCGNNNGILVDDTTLRGGHKNSDLFAFGTSWNVHDTENLFSVKFKASCWPMYTLYYCACYQQDYDYDRNTIILYYGTLDEAFARHRGCAQNEITDNIFMNPQRPSFMRRASISPPNFTTHKALTKNETRMLEIFKEECEAVFLQNTVIESCIQTGVLTQERMNNALLNCIADVETGIHNAFTVGHLTAIMQACAELAKNVPKEVFDMLPIDEICPGACNLLGTCVNGACVCNNGYPDGSDCGFSRDDNDDEGSGLDSDDDWF